MLTPAQQAEFDQFYAAHPLHKGKLDAMKAWGQVSRTEPNLLALCLAALPWQRLTDQWRQGFIPYPATYLRAGRFYDEPTETERYRAAEEARHEAACRQAMESARQRHDLTRIQ